jgi:hypothetical protein
MYDDRDYDYYGTNKRNYDDDDFREALNAVFDTKQVIEGFPTIPLVAQMIEEDRTLLEDHVPLLFTTLPKDKDLYDSIFELAKLIMQYRSDRAGSSNVKPINSLSPTHQNKSDEGREAAFIQHIEKLYFMMGGERIGTEAGNKLKKILEDAHDHPQKYLIKRHKAYTASLKPIEDYFKSLKLYNRTNQIKDFIKALRNLP